MKEDKKAAKKKSATAKESSEAAEEKVFDVSRPGEAAPSASSRPLIISHRPGVSSDPMVSATDAPAEDEAKKDGNEKKDPEADQASEEVVEQVLKAPKKNRIEPLNPTITLEDKKDPSSDVEVIEEKTEDDAIDDAKDNASKEEKRDETDDISEEIEDVSASLTTKKQAKEDEAKKAQQELERRAEIEKLIENKHFFVSINSVQKRRSRRAVIVLGLLVIVAIGVLAALDAEIIDIGIDPLTDFL